MEKSNFDKLLTRYLTGQTSEAEKVRIEAWLDVMKTESTKDMELNKEDEEKLYQKIISTKDNIKEIESFLPFRDEEKKISRTGWFLRIASSLLMIVLVGYAIWTLTDNGRSYVFSASKGIEKIILNDGTLVWLQKDSRLVYLEDANDNQRYAELEGEALFEVAKDPDHPFVVKFNGATVKVVGTSFSLSTSGNEVLVKVLTGKVNLSHTSNVAGVDLEPNQKGILTPSGEIKKESMQSNELKDITDGTDYVMGFTDESLNEVLLRLGRKFDVSFKLVTPNAGTCRITADLTDQSLERSQETIQEILNVRFESKGNFINVEGPGCK
jgi:ferric-dicitrate binding protein FerR (iron transport regulator)